jgi:predicted helicase
VLDGDPVSARKINESLIRKAPKSTKDLLALLFDGLDWPRPAGMEIEEIPLISWSPDELHLDPNTVAKLDKIQQIPRLTATQPFGIFILTFGHGQLPIGAVRRVVERVVRKKRAQATSSPLWDLHDLIFFCQSHEGVGTLHIVAFKETDGVPVMKVISWNTDATDNRIQLIAGESLPDLIWPEVGASDDEWRTQWEAAFDATYRQGVKSAAALAEKMAEVARNVRDESLALYDVETDKGPLRLLFQEVRRNLRADLTPQDFADMYAQTMVYGLLTARITHPEDFHADAINSVLKFENPFLDSMYSSFRRKGDQAFDVDEFGLHDLAELLAKVDVNQLLADFGIEERKDDPVVFFYEAFLQKYDPEQRKELGTYYTPIPVVRFMVRAVDHLIKSRFGLADGLADDTTWAAYSKGRGIPIPEGIAPTDAVIRMIDPATGTGTFLLEWFRQASKNLGPKATLEQRLRVLDRMDAFEISLSSYAVAQLKVSLELPAALRSRTHVNIRLSDTLAGKRPMQGNFFGDDPIAEEGKRAESIKFEARHSVVIGNPPYGDKSKGKGGWIEGGEGGDRSNTLLDDFREPGNGSLEYVLSNLYVYFWRWALWKLQPTETSQGPKVVCFITASAWLSGPGFAGMRRFIREVASEILVVDLGGEAQGPRKSANVFPIQRPVAIVIVVLDGKANATSPGKCSYSRLEGTSQEKLRTLSQLRVDEIDWTECGSGWTDRMIPSSGEIWEQYPSLPDLFPWSSPGVKPNRTFVYGVNREVLEERWSRLIAAKGSDRGKLMKETRDRKIGGRFDPLPGFIRQRSTIGDEMGGIPELATVAYRPLDRTLLIADIRLLDRARPDLWATRSSKQVFMTEFHAHSLGPGPGVIFSHEIPDNDHFRGSYAGRVFPLWRDSSCTIPNVTPRLIEFLGNGVTDEDLMAYIACVVSHRGYVERFSEELRNPGVRVPMTRDPIYFREAVVIGEECLNAWTFGAFNSARRMNSNFMSEPSNVQIVTPIPTTEMPETVSYDSLSEVLTVGRGTLSGISRTTWNYDVSGYLVVQQWLKRRLRMPGGKKSSPLDQVVATTWTDAMSDELVEILNEVALLVLLEERQSVMLETILGGSLISIEELEQANILPAPESSRRAIKKQSGQALD